MTRAQTEATLPAAQSLAASLPASLPATEPIPEAVSAPSVLDDSGVMQLLQISRTLLNRLLSEGLPFLRVGDVRRYRAESVLTWCEQNAKSKAAAE